MDDTPASPTGPDEPRKRRSDDGFLAWFGTLFSGSGESRPADAAGKSALGDGPGEAGDAGGGGDGGDGGGGDGGGGADGGGGGD